MGGIGNVVVNTIVRRMITRKAVGTAMKSAKKGKASRAPKKNKVKANNNSKLAD